jgi:hypothetical protein
VIRQLANRCFEKPHGWPARLASGRPAFETIS